MQIPIGQGSAGGLTANGGNLSSAGGTGVGSAGATAAAAAAETALTKRLPNTTASLPIVYGSIAFYLGKKADELETHEWTLFLRGPNQLDDHLNSLVISKVVFQLHASFAQPTRELTEPPYEVTERGWGEFEAQIRIHWKDPSEQTTIVNHTIKLYPQGTPPTPSATKNELVQQSTEKPVLAETYDEVVFTDPTESFFRSLTQITAVPPDASHLAEETTSSFIAPSSANNNNESTKGDDKKSRSIANSSSTPKAPWKDHLTNGYSDQEDFLALIAAQTFLKEELGGIKQRFQHVTDEISVVDQKLFLAQQQKQREAAAAAVRGTGSSATSGGESRKRTKKSRSTSSQNKRPRTSGGSSGKSAAGAGGGSSTTAAGSSKRATTPSRAGASASAAAKTSAKTATKAAAASAAATATATATKKGNSNSSGASIQASAQTKK
jgi:YEATS domain-containing protein 4